MAGIITEAHFHHLQRLGDEFTKDTLAYLLLSSKDERLLCGMLARRLHEAFLADPETMIRREWPIPGNTNQQIDIAVLRRGNPVVLIESKAAMSFDMVKRGKQPFPIDKVKKDIDRLRGIEFDGERYALLFVTGYHELPGPEFDPALPYSKVRRRHGVIDDDRLAAGFGRFHRAVGKPLVLHRGEVGAGSAFHVDVSLYYWVLDASA